MLIVGLLGSAALWAQVSVSGNKSRLIFDIEEGHFSFHYREIPFFDNIDLINNEIVIWDNDRQHNLDSTSKFTYKQDRSDSIIPRFSWKSRELLIEQNFMLLEPDGFQIRFDITNISEETRIVGLRYIFDTILGEDGDTQFYFSDGAPIKSEMTLVPAITVHPYIISAAQPDDEAALQLILSDETVIAPDRVIFANWWRLTRSIWRYRTRTSNDFSIAPFGAPDGAVAYYYDPQPLRAGDTRTIIILMGKTTPEGYSATPPQVVPDDPFIDIPVLDLLGSRFTLNELLRFLAAIDLLLDELLALEKEPNPNLNEVQRLSDRVRELTNQITRGGDRPQTGADSQ